MKSILVIITGSVAAFKALELIRMFTNVGFNVKCVLSRGGEEFVTPLSVSALSGNEVITHDTYKMEHITLSRNVDAIIVCPASANFINKLSNGTGGEIALDIMLAKKPQTPVILCPAMNVEMWYNLKTQSSITSLLNQNYYIIDPKSGNLLCGEEGSGKLEDIDIIFEKTTSYLYNFSRLRGKKALVTLGGTIERIDDVRYISNFSSGMQGLLLVNQLAIMGAEVFAVIANVKNNNLRLPEYVKVIRVESGREMHRNVINIIENQEIDYFFSTAAVSDFYVKNKISGKIKKDKGLNLKFDLNPDILKDVTCHKKRPKFVCGFAVEEKENLLKNGKKKFKEKGVDLLFVNGFNFGDVETEGFVISKNKSQSFAGSKDALARLLCSFL